MPPKGGRKDEMKNHKYNSFDELPLMLSVPEMASVLGIRDRKSVV